MSHLGLDSIPFFRYYIREKTGKKQQIVKVYDRTKERDKYAYASTHILWGKNERLTIKLLVDI